MTTRSIPPHQLAKLYGVVPERHMGQNFLVNPRVVDAIVTAAGVDTTRPVVEIGAGFGILTERLVATGAEVYAVERDDQCVDYLKKTFSGTPNIHLIADDVFTWFAREQHRFKAGGYAVVANLPYSIATHVLRVFLEAARHPSRMTVLLQKEVADRLVARPGEMSVLSLMGQAYSTPRIVKSVSAGNFWPVPKVASAVVLFDTVGWRFPGIIEEDFFRIAKAGFSARRKKLLNALHGVLRTPLEDLRTVFAHVGVSENARAQELSLEQWKKLVGRFVTDTRT